MDYRIFPPDEIIDVTVELPLSKSMAVRTIVLDHLAGKPSSQHLRDICSDTRTAAAALEDIKKTDRIDIGSAGTAMRFVTAIAAATDGCHCLITGDERMQQRPIAPLVDALRALGADITYRGNEGCPPLEIKGRRLKGGNVDIDASVSSQFVSALMLAAPLMDSALAIRYKGDVQSRPYVAMTAAMLSDRGISCEADRDGVVVDCGTVATESMPCERDWSAAAFWYEIAALSGGWVTLKDMSSRSLQADSAEAALFERLGALTAFDDGDACLSATPDLFNSLDADMSDMPDAVPALVVTAVLAGIPFRLTGIAALREKECDRVQALIDEMLKLGVILETADYGNTLVSEGRRVPVRELPVFDSHADHRMAMALAPVAIFIPGIVVGGAECVSKSYPAFWEDLQKAGFTVTDAREEPAEQA